MQRCVLGISYLYHINDLGILHVTFSKIQLVNLDILVQTPGRLASAHPIPQLIMPPKKYFRGPLVNRKKTLREHLYNRLLTKCTSQNWMQKLSAPKAF